MRDWRNVGLAATIFIVILIPIAGIKFNKRKLDQTQPKEPIFVGGQKCKECHEAEYKLWETSHHAHAMASATDSTVLGNFDNVSYTHNGITHRFFKKNNKFFVHTRGPGGKMGDFEITHTFGYTPLQQYLVPFDKGKYQCLPIAWDTEKKEWFDMGAMVYEDENIHPGDWLYWTNQAQNWNGMCAECHSTHLQKNYIHELDSFNTTWSEINVSCEACHGPGSKHIIWADLPEIKQKEDPGSGLVVKTSELNNREYVELCVRCHSRRSQLGDYDHKAKDLLDFMIPTLLNEDYFPDGQILDEDYVYGSFVQSKMYHNDIKCNDCHNVHSGNRHQEGNTLCLQCHQASYYATANHHFHKTSEEGGPPLVVNGKKVVSGEGASCVNCHMPGRYYMGIDFRNDHSIRVPRPDLSKEIGVPNACNQCHTDKSTDWAIKWVEKWYGKKEKPHYGTTLASARNNNPDAVDDLISLINDELAPLIVRATALEHLTNYADESAKETIRQQLDSPESMLRHSAIRAYNSNNIEEYLADLGPLLNDPVKAVRMQAALLISSIPNEYIPENLQENYRTALLEFREQNEYMGDFPGGSANLGIMYSNLGDNNSAIKNYEKAIATDSAYTPAMVNLALVYNRVGRNQDAEQVYKELISRNPDLPGIQYSLGLLLAEEKRYDEAIKFLEIASKKNPQNSRINYNLSLLYTQFKKVKEAEKQLGLALNLEPENFDYQYALAHLYVQSAQYSKAERLLIAMKKKFPGNNNITQLYNYLQQVR